jgi:hypothetical protein
MLKLGGNYIRMEFEYSIWMILDDAKHRKRYVPGMRCHHANSNLFFIQGLTSLAVSTALSAP